MLCKFCRISNRQIPDPGRVVLEHEKTAPNPPPEDAENGENNCKLCEMRERKLISKIRRFLGRKRGPESLFFFNNDL